MGRLKTGRDPGIPRGSQRVKNRKCCRCNLSFPEDTLATHLSGCPPGAWHRNHPTKKYCSRCTKMIPKTDFEDHRPACRKMNKEKIAKGIRKRQCSRCCKGFHQSTFEAHWKTCTGRKDGRKKCNRCTRRVPESTFAAHWDGCAGRTDGKRRCSRCKGTFNEDSFSAHWDGCKGRTDGKKRCNRCRRTFPESTFAAHWKACLLKPVVRRMVPPGKKKCGCCGRLIFESDVEAHWPICPDRLFRLHRQAQGICIHSKECTKPILGDSRLCKEHNRKSCLNDQYR